jgi:hypothetical protein
MAAPCRVGPGDPEESWAWREQATEGGGLTGGRPLPKPRRPSARSGSMRVYQLKLTLQGIEPPVWRRLQVPAMMRLGRLHRVFQVTMGWTNSHLHEFVVADTHYGEPNVENEPMNVLPERKVTLGQVAPGENDSFTYVYDFGDHWEHEVLVEKLAVAGPADRYPICLTGERCCPPEDCGGPPGYAEFLEAIRDPRHPQHAEMLQWAGGQFNPEAFSVAAVNRTLRRVR